MLSKNVFRKKKSDPKMLRVHPLSFVIFGANYY